MSYNFNSIPTVPPTGSVAPFTGTTDPSGWVICDGVSRSNASGQYNNLINANLVNITSSTFSINASTGSGASTNYLPATYTFNQMATSQNGQLILAGNNSSGFLYLSTNRGNTWSIQLNSLSANWYTAAMSATTGQFMLAGNNSFLYLSMNSGASWQPISGSAYGSSYGLFTTTGNWSSSAISNAGQYMLAGMNTGSLYLSTSFGNSWRLLGGATNTNGMPTSAVNWSSCSMNASGSLMSACVSSGAVYLSTNSGTNWSTAYGLSTSAPWSNVSIASSANYVIAAANIGNIYLSTDGAGATWSKKTGPVGNPTIVAVGSGINSMAYSYDGINFTGLGTNIFIRCNAVASNGSRWVAVGFGSCSIAYSDDGINWTKADAGSLIFSTEGQCVTYDGIRWIAGGVGTNVLAYSTSNGVSWTPINTGFSFGLYGIHGVASSGSTWVVTSTGNSNLIKSTNSGNTWVTLAGFSNLSWAVTYANNTWILSCNTPYLYYSTNGAATFTLALSSIFASDAHASAYSPTQNKWVAIGENYTGTSNFAAYSTNGGVSWIPSANGTANIMYGTGTGGGGAFRVFSGVAWTGTYWVAVGGPNTATGLNNTIAYSADGITWTGLGVSIFGYGCGVAWNGLSPGFEALQSLAISGDGTKLISGTSISNIYASTTSGNTWTNIGGESNVVGLPNAASSNWSSMTISQDGSTWLADVKNAQLYISRDGQGKLWGINSKYNIGIGTWNALAISPDGSIVVAGNTSSNLFVSYNSGYTYNEVDSYGNLSGTKNWTGAAVSSNNQIMTACANGDYVYLSSNSGRTWSNQASTTAYTVPSVSTIGQSWSAVQPTTYTGIGQNWTLIPNGLTSTAASYFVAMSSTGQFILSGQYLGTNVGWLSTNYGTNWSTNLPTLSGSTYAVSATGQYMISGSSPNYYSSTYGSSWTTIGSNGSILCMSYSGQYVFAGNTGANMSSSYGVYWKSCGATGGVNINSACMSATGQYILVPVNNGTVNLSTSYGVYWTQSVGTGLSGTAFYWCSGMSATGQYMLIAAYSNGGAYLSSNYGANWSIPTNLTGLNLIPASVSVSGQIMLVAVYGGASHLSTNYGVNWAVTTSTSGKNYRGTAISATGQYMALASDVGIFVSSASLTITITTGYGQNFTPLSLTGAGAVSNEYWIWPAVSQTGQYILVCSFVTGGRVYLSTNFGSSFVNTPGSGLATGGQRWLATAMNYTGQYMLAGINETSASNTYLSTNYGVNWAALNQTGKIQCISISSTGQYILLSFTQSYIYLSSTYGAGFYVPNGILSSNRDGCSMTPDGKYMSATGDNAVSMSTNYGVSWITTPGTGLSSSDNYQTTAMTSNGYFVTMTYGVTSVSSGNIYVSSNYGVNWRSSTGGMGIKNYFASIAISQFGQYIIISTDGQGFVLSTNYGNSWTNPITSGTFWGCTMTPDAKYMLTCLTSGTLYRSSAITSTTTQLSPTVTTTTPLATSITSSAFPYPYWYSVTTDQTGQYVVVGSIMNQGIWYSANFATTWQNSNQILGTVQQLANSGTYMLAAINNISGVWYSSNYGAWWQSAASSTSNNFASVAMSSSSTYAIAGSFDGGVTYSSTYGQSWKTSNLTTNTYLEVAMSSTGQYALASNNTTVYYSTNFGQTFIASSLTSINTQSLSISASGQFAVAGTTAGIYYSMNYGQTWTQALGQASTGTWYGINMMSSGQYVVAGNAGQGLWYSLTGGQTWTQSTTNKTDTWYQISTTPSGSYLYAVSQSDTIYQETNVTSSMSISNGLPNSTSSWQTLSMNNTGQYQIAGVNTGYLFYTNNYGNDWTTLSGPSLITGANNTNGLPTSTSAWNTTKINSTGQYVLAGINGGALYISTNTSTTWTAISGSASATNYGMTTNALTWQTTSMNSTGQYMMAGILYDFLLYLSTNYGSYWTAIVGGGASSLITPNVSADVTPTPSSSNPWTINGVTWTSSVSSFYNNDSAYSSLKVFDNSTAAWNTDATSQYNNISGVYTGTAFGTSVSAPISSTIYGEWVQIQSSVPFIIQNYKLTSGDAAGRGPKIFYIVGSNNGTTWYPIQYVNIAGNPYSAPRIQVSNSISAQTQVSGVTFGTSTITTTVYPTSGGTYTYFRMIVTSIVGNYDNTLSFGEWLIYFSSLTKRCSSAISSTGQRMAIGLTANAFYFSQNYGKNWTAYSNSPLSSSVNWQSMSMSSNGLAIVANATSSNVYNINAVPPTATYTPPQISGTTSTDGTTVNYIIKL